MGAETTIGEIRQKVQEWKPEYSLEQIELVCKDKDAWGPLFNKTSRPRDDDETVESTQSDWDIPRRMMQVALWIKERNERLVNGRALSGKCWKSPNVMIGVFRVTPYSWFLVREASQSQISMVIYAQQQTLFNLLKVTN